jgi:exosortase/archaeosortase family protein
VVEACSGIRSLMTLVTLAVVFAYFTHPHQDPPEGSKRGPLSWLKSYGFWRSTIIVLAALPIAILTNALRVSGTGVLAHYYGTEIADGFFHSFSGWVIYIAAFLMLFGVGWILDRFRPSRRDVLRAPSSKDERVSTENRTTAVGGSSSAAVPVIPAEGTE